MIGIIENIPGDSKSMITDGVLSDMIFFPYALVLYHFARTGPVLVPCCTPARASASQTRSARGICSAVKHESRI